MTMILYGRDLSPFARRVAIWCALQERELERRPLTVAGEDFDKLKAINPVGRVPILVPEDGEPLIETAAIIDWLEETAPADRRLIPGGGPERRKVMQGMAFGNSVVEKGVALVYEKNRRPEEFQWPEWRARIEGQIAGGLEALEARIPESGWMGGANPDGADVCAAIAHDFLAVTNPHVLEGGYPRLKALAARAAEHPAFAASKPAV